MEGDRISEFAPASARHAPYPYIFVGAMAV